MATDCCKLVGNFNISINGCITSLNLNCSTEILNACGDSNPLEGPTIQTLSLSGYASDTIHKGCPGKAGVSIPWVRKFDCDNNEVYFIFAGEGQSFQSGDVADLAAVKYPVNTVCQLVSANSSSGPAALYMDSTQINGYGLTFSGDPFSFTTDEIKTVIDISCEVVTGEFYLQSFNLDVNPGQLPISNYTMVRSIT